MAELIERIAFEAREDKRVDRRSGVSQRLPISVLDNVLSNAERRTIVTKEKTVVPRISDVYAALPAITGKLELEYEGELQGSETIAKDLIRRAAGRTFEGRVGGANVDDIVHWFDEGGALKITPDERSEALLKGFTVVPGLLALIDQVGLAGRKIRPRWSRRASSYSKGSWPRSGSRAARSSATCGHVQSRNLPSEKGPAGGAQEQDPTCSRSLLHDATFVSRKTARHDHAPVRVRRVGNRAAGRGASGLDPDRQRVHRSGRPAGGPIDRRSRPREERAPGLLERLARTPRRRVAGDVHHHRGDRGPCRNRRGNARQMTERVIAEAAAEGRVVLVGRGAQAVLATRPNALHVYVIASKPFRRKVAIDRLSVDPAKVDKVIDETDHQRDQYVKTHYGRDRQDLTQYDFVLNAERLGFEGAAELVVAEVRRRRWV